jgi:hypothetical protein
MLDIAPNSAISTLATQVVENRTGRVAGDNFGRDVWLFPLLLLRKAALRLRPDAIEWCSFLLLWRPACRSRKYCSVFSDVAAILRQREPAHVVHRVQLMN